MFLIAWIPPKLLARPVATSTSSGPPRVGCRKSGSVTRPGRRSAIAASSSTDLRQRAVARSYKPTRPVGEKTMKATNSRPKKSNQFSVTRDSESRNITKNRAPSAGPRKDRMPPMITIASNSPENATEIGSAEVMRLLNASSMPASPVRLAEATNAVSLTRLVG